MCKAELIDVVVDEWIVSIQMPCHHHRHLPPAVLSVIRGAELDKLDTSWTMPVADQEIHVPCEAKGWTSKLRTFFRRKFW